MRKSPYWKHKSLSQMTSEEWEALCDGCGRCCLLKLENEDTGEVFHTEIACRLLDRQTCRCSDYDNRSDRVPGCLHLTAERVSTLSWLPATCAYRLVAEGKDLPWWHPLISGDPDSVHRAGISVRGRTVAESDVAEEDWEDFIVDWPAADR